jgi:hypothetical protein
MKIFSFALFSSVVLGTAAPAAAEVGPRFRPVPVGDVRKLRTSKAFEVRVPLSPMTRSAFFSCFSFSLILTLL